MANLPILRSKEQIMGELIAGFLSRAPHVNDLHPGSVLMQFLEAVAQSNFKSTATVISMIDALSIDRAVGDALRRLAADKNVPIFPALPASGKINITDLSFKKIASTIYAGQPAPVVGSLTIYVADASNFPPKGSIYIGRGTANVEGPLYYNSVISESGGTYWRIVLESYSPTTKFHNIGEQVIVGQGGNRNIAAGTVVRTKSGSGINPILFTTTADALILDGETTATDIPVVCQTPGTIGNVIRGAIQEAVALPFKAQVFNPQPFTNGRAEDNDDQIRERIKQYEQLKAKGTAAAIYAAAVSVSSAEEHSRVTSASIITNPDKSTLLTIDDGTGYEYKIRGVGVEHLIDQAMGGEQYFQLRQYPVAFATITSVQAEPYNMTTLKKLSVTVGHQEYVHYFKDSDFKVPSAATAFEIVVSINNNPTINFSASTVDNRSRVMIFSRDRDINEIKVNKLDENDANQILQFPLAPATTLRLYKNDTPLYEDGQYASVTTLPQSQWSTGIQPGCTLQYSVDGTPPITATFTLQEFQKIRPDATVSYATDLDTWASVMNNIMPGVTATVQGSSIVLSSNKGEHNDASIKIIGGTLKDQIFSSTTASEYIYSSGRESDFTLNRQTGQIKLRKPLVANDRLAVGSYVTRANVTTTPIPDGVTEAGRVWFVVDGEAQYVPHGLQVTTLLSFNKDVNSNELIITAKTTNGAPEGFEELKIGDWLLIWAHTSDTQLQPAQGIWRIKAVQKGEIIVQSRKPILQSITINNIKISLDCFVCVRSNAPLQRLAFNENTSLYDFVETAKSQLTGIDVDIVGSSVRFSTQTADETGNIFVVAVDDGGRNLSLSVGVLYNNIPSHTAFTAVDVTSTTFPSFTHGIIDQANTSTIIKDTQFQDIGGSAGMFLEILDSYDSSNLKLLPNTNAHYQSHIIKENINNDPSLIEILPPKYMQAIQSTSFPYDDLPKIQANDRYFLRSTYQFDVKDNVSVVVDNQPTTQLYHLPVSRKVIVDINDGAPTNTSFYGKDGESSLPLHDVASFGDFNFKAFKLLRRSLIELLLMPNSNNKMRLTSTLFGALGNRVAVGISYPTIPTLNQITHKVNIGDIVCVDIIPKFQSTISINPDTAWTMSISSVNNDDNTETVHYQYRVGDPAPSFSGVSVGDLAIFTNDNHFLSSYKNYSAQIVSVDDVNYNFTIIRPRTRETNHIDELSINDCDNLNGLLTITTSGNHGVRIYDRIGLYNTAVMPNNNQPFETIYTVTQIVNDNQFIVSAPNTIPGGEIKSITWMGNRIIVETTKEHNLLRNEIVWLSNLPISNLSGIYSVMRVNSPTIFTCISDNQSTGVQTATGGRFDLQNFGIVGTSFNINTASRDSNGIITITTNGDITGTITNSDLILMRYVDIDDWQDTNTYTVGDVVEYNSILYKCIADVGPSSTPPNQDIAHWKPAINNEDWDLSGVFHVQSVTYDSINDITTLTFQYDDIGGTTIGTGGNIVLMGITGKLARCVGVNGALHLGKIVSTAQDIIDYVTNNMSQLLTAEMTENSDSNTVVSLSTADVINANQAGLPQYIGGVISGIKTIMSSRIVKFTVTKNVPAGSLINIQNLSSPYEIYNGQYLVHNSVYDDINDISVITVQATQLATLTEENSCTGFYRGAAAHIMLCDGENYIESTAKISGKTALLFTASNAWQYRPLEDEEIYIQAYTAEQLQRFWNIPIVSGISNVADIDYNAYDTQLQLSTKTFGVNGAIQVMGGTANSVIIAVSGSGNYTDKIGYCFIPSALLNGFNANQWIQINQTVCAKKEINFNTDTKVKVFYDGLEIVSGSGSFQTKRDVNITHETALKIEQHGQFTAFIHIDGPNPQFYNVQEGDWVRITNIIPKSYDNTISYKKGMKVLYNTQNYICINDTSGGVPPTDSNYWKLYATYQQAEFYNAGDYVLCNERLWLALQDNQNIIPGTDDTVWQANEFNTANTGIYQVVRVFATSENNVPGSTFWVKIPNPVEELTKILDPRNLSFYSYDSIMPGDTLVIDTPELGAPNIGRYTVKDDAMDGSTLFPTDKRIYTTNIPYLQRYGIPLWVYGQSYTINSNVRDPYDQKIYSATVDISSSDKPPSKDSERWEISTTYTSSDDIPLGNNYLLVFIEEAAPLELIKRIITTTNYNTTLAAVIVDSPNLMNRIADIYGAYIQATGKLNWDTSVHYGIDGYKYFTGLLAAVNRAVYGDPTNVIQSPGVRAAGTDIDIIAAILRRIYVSLNIRIRSDVLFSIIRDAVKAAVAGYVNSLGVGEHVSLSAIVAAANSVDGVISVVITHPTYDISNDLILIQPHERAIILDPTTDVTVSVTAT